MAAVSGEQDRKCEVQGLQPEPNLYMCAERVRAGTPISPRALMSDGVKKHAQQPSRTCALDVTASSGERGEVQDMQSAKSVPVATRS